ncbi:MAG TPA: hypothetical protein VIL32_00445, partial [Steroidobacteraceae bacterium]
MVSGDVSAPHDRESDVTFTSHTASTSLHGDTLEILIATCSRSTTERQRGAGRCVLLVAMMRFHDFDIEAWRQRSCTH